MIQIAPLLNRIKPSPSSMARQRARELHTSEGIDPIEGSPEGIDAEGGLA